jgi:hypothetical protein
MLVIKILPPSPHRKMAIAHDQQDCCRMQIRLRRTSLARPSDRSSAATRFIANTFQGTNVVRRRRDKPLQAPRTMSAVLDDDRFRLLQILAQRSSRQSIHIGHALGSGFVQSIFSPPSRRPPFKCFPSVSRRDAELKILCNPYRSPISSLKIGSASLATPYGGGLVLLSV